MSLSAAPLPEWKAALRAAADEAYRLNPGPGELPPEVTARIRRILFRSRPLDAEQAA